MKKWILFNLGWIFTKNRNRAAWGEYLRKKYGEGKIDRR